MMNEECHVDFCESHVMKIKSRASRLPNGSFFIFLLAMLLVPTASPAQQHHQPNGQDTQQRHEFSPERFNQHMEQFITDHAGLTPEEATAFFPLLHEMLDHQRENNDKQRQVMGQCSGGQPTEAQYEQAIMATIDLEEENKRIERTYYRKFSSVLSWEKIHKVRTALIEFQMEALRRFSPPQQQQQPHRRDFQHWDWSAHEDGNR